MEQEPENHLQMGAMVQCCKADHVVSLVGMFSGVMEDWIVDGYHQRMKILFVLKTL